MREAAQMVERRGDLGSASKAVAHHPLDPAWVRGAGMDGAGDLLGQRARLGMGRIARVEMIERRRAFPQRRPRRREPRLMRGIIGGQQQVAFGQVVEMDKGLRPRHPRGDPVRIAPVAIVERGGRGGEPALPRLDPRRFVVTRIRVQPDAIAPRRGAIDARGSLSDKRVPVRRFVARGQRPHRLSEQCDQMRKGVAEQPDTRSVTSTRGRSKRISGITSNPVTRSER